MSTVATYPALYRHDTQKLCPLRGRSGDRISVVVGRSRNANYRLDSVQCSRRQFQVSFRDGQWAVEALSAQVPTLRNGVALQQPTTLLHGDRIDVLGICFVYLEHAVDAEVTTLAGAGGSAKHSTRWAIEEPIRIGTQIVIGRTLPSGVLLNHPMVSRRHAMLRRQGNCFLVRDLNSQNGTWLNGERVKGEQIIAEHSRLDIGPYSFRLADGVLVNMVPAVSATLVARGLSRQVPTPDGSKTILDKVSLAIESERFTCLVGPSGSGKTTLLNALSAREKATEGIVLLDGHDLYRHFELLKPCIALVPQQELLHGSLTVAQAIEATARLRLPVDTQDAEIEELVEDSLAQVELLEQADTRVRDLSGGQRKRASLANEIVCRPRILFLDEVTSGLDEQTDGEMMRLFRQLAHDGMTVICVTHTLANVEPLCDTVVVMAPGGVLAFAGTPSEANDWFTISRLAEVYAKLASRSVEEWRLAFRTSQLYRRRIAPYIEHDSADHATSLPPDSGRRPAFLHQFPILVRRYARIVLADRKTLMIACLQAAAIGLIIALAFTLDSAPAERALDRSTLAFVVGICALWFGCNNAAKEIVKERGLYRRERDVNLSVTAYVGSKLMLLLGLGILQVLVLLLAIACVGELPSAFVPTCGVLVVTVATGTGLGLLISACCTTEDQAAALVPVSILPQIILANSLVTLEAWLAVVSKLLTSGWWSNSALQALIPPQDASAAWESCGWLVLQGIVFVGGSLAVLVFRDSR